MCGFFQVFQKNTPVDPTAFRASLDLIKHRGPDDTGTSFHQLPATGDAPALHLANGHQRLAILDLDPRSAQPFERDQHSLLFNGEIYNFRQLRPALEKLGSQFETTGDTEVLLRGLQHHGTAFLPELNGMWAFSFFNHQDRSLLLSRDRHGKKPLFYYEDDTRLIVSSLINPIRHYLGLRPRLRTEALHAYLQHGAMYPGADEQTPYHDIQQVLPGQSLRIQLDSGEKREKTSHFYDPLTPEKLHREASPERLAADLKDAVALRLVSDRPVGLLLSGGIDSSLVLSVLHASGLHEQVQCFIGEAGRSEDADYARRSAEKIGIKAHLIDLSYRDDTLQRFLKMCLHHEKAFPFLGNAMGMSEMYEHVARENVPVVIDGTGGDEQFGGYWDRGFASAVRQALREGDWTWLRQMAASSKEIRQRISSELPRYLGDNSRYSLDLKNRRRRLSPAYRALGLDLHPTPSPDPLAIPPSEFLESLRRDLAPGGRLGEWIWHNDRNAMMSGIENRSPLLDFRIRQHIGTGYHAKIRDGWTKYELRKIFDHFTPLPTQWRRQKQGFRWNGKQFLRQNRPEILDIIASSQVLRAHYDLDRFLDLARKRKRTITHALTPRLLCIAGLEQGLNITHE
ncbi:MAG: asparagine synthase (glutamine-hydrolyzing) [Verrucomicrobiales bacterium]